MGRGIGGMPVHHASLRTTQQPHSEFRHDGLRDFVLDGEDVAQRPVESARPDVTPVRGPDQLRRHPHAVGRALNRPFEDGSHGQQAPNLRGRRRPFP